MSLIYFIIGLFFLYLSKQWLTVTLGRLIHRFGGSRHVLIVVWSVIFLPGTVIHELSHFFFAIITGARTGKIEIFPEYLESDWEDENSGGEVALGYVQTQRLNLLQGFFVGSAPFIVGILLLVYLSSLLQITFNNSHYLFLVLQGYLFFTIANSFFPSWSDIRQTIPLVVVTTILAFVIWTVGLPLLFSLPLWIDGLIQTISLILFLSSFLNFFVSGLFFLLLMFSKKHYRR